MIVRISGERQYELVEGWGQLPEGWTWGQVAGVACDSQDRVHVYTRTEHPYMVFDKKGKLIDEWGGEIFGSPHGICITPNDDVYLVREERPQHAPADAGDEAGVIGCRPHARPQQRARDQLRQPSCGCVDEGCTGGVPDAFPDRGEPLAIVAHALDDEVEIGTIERGDDDLGVRHP